MNVQTDPSIVVKAGNRLVNLGHDANLQLNYQVN